MTLEQNQTTTSDVPRASRSTVGQPGDRVPENSLFDQVTRALTKAVHENIYRSRLMALAGHDLKQPLQVISMLLELLTAQIADPGAKPRMQLAHESIKRIADGLDRLALASRLDIDPDLPQRTIFPVADVLQLIKPTWQEHAANKGVELRVCGSSAYVTSDVAMLTTILDNFIGNAIKYTPRGLVLVGCRRVRDHVSIQVLDTGVGIQPERLEQIFVAFHQEDPASGGLGLGLSIAQRTATILGHRVRVRSEVARGSAFCIEVPGAAAPDLRLRLQPDLTAT
ncbi:MAG: HAMP domain-containing sensor histidine kinase [Rudaea sp.]|nr:HAMP domain-containing sensor histidine kinase [Rudaea sp.]